MTERNRSEELFGGIRSRGRDYTEAEIDGIWHYGFQYSYLGEIYHVVFEREYKLEENLVDAVVDNFQIKQHGGILFPITVKDGAA